MTAILFLPVWVANLDHEDLYEGHHGTDCPCIRCVVANGPPKYFAEGPPLPVSDLYTREDLEYLGYRGLYRVRKKPWKTPKTNTEGRRRVEDE